MDTDTTDDRESIDADPTDSLDLTHPDRVRIGVTRGETDLEIGPPREYPDRADVAVRPATDADELESTDDDHRLLLTVDAMAGDHGTGHADVVLSPAEARALAAELRQTVRWMTEPDELDAED